MTGKATQDDARDVVQRVTVAPERAAEMLDISRSVTFALIRDGDLPSFKLGKRRMVLVDGIRAYAARQVAEQSHPSAATA